MTPYERITTSIQQYNKRPTDREWEIADENGWTVAHYWIQQHAMPTGFKQWDLADSDGWTVAHAAITLDRLPRGFNQWHLKDNKGDTVAHVAVRHCSLIEKVLPKDVLEIQNNKGETVAAILKAARSKQLTELKAMLIGSCNIPGLNQNYRLE